MRGKEHQSFAFFFAEIYLLSFLCFRWYLKGWQAHHSQETLQLMTSSLEQTVAQPQVKLIYHHNCCAYKKERRRKIEDKTESLRGKRRESYSEGGELEEGEGGKG